MSTKIVDPKTGKLLGVIDEDNITIEITEEWLKKNKDKIKKNTVAKEEITKEDII